MSRLIAKIREKSKTSSDKLRLVMSDEIIFNHNYDFSDAVEFSPATLLENEQWYIINNFSQKEYCLDFLKDVDFNSVDYKQLEASDFEKLDFLISYQDESYYFQNISKSQLIRKKLLSFGEQFKFEHCNASIAIKEAPDAVYSKSKDNLYFRKLSSISSIFHGIDQLHREATETETTEFLSQDFIALVDDFSSKDVKIPNRKRIALALDTLNNLKDDDKKTVFAYIKDYCPDLSISEESFSIADDDDLKLLLFGIEQRFYTTPVGDEKRIANSIMLISSNSKKNSSTKRFSFV